MDMGTPIGSSLRNLPIMFLVVSGEVSVVTLVVIFLGDWVGYFLDSSLVYLVGNSIGWVYCIISSD